MSDVSINDLLQPPVLHIKQIHVLAAARCLINHTSSAAPQRQADFNFDLALKNHLLAEILSESLNMDALSVGGVELELNLFSTSSTVKLCRK